MKDRMSTISRRNFIYLLSSTTFLATQKISIAETIPPSWDSIRKIDMKGNLKAFWNIVGGDNKANQLQAIQHGFEIASGMNSYADYPGKQKENILSYIGEKYINPWVKPPFFEKIVKRNIKQAEHSHLFYHDLEFPLEKDVWKLWQNPNLRKLSKANNFESFVESYYQEWATWYSLPCKWSKELYPDEPIGIYGPQVFNRDYQGFFKPLQLEQSHSSDLQLWKHIDPYVDYYASSAYIVNDSPDSIYYMAANVEQNYFRSRKFSNKPLYDFQMLKLHSLKKELPGYIVAAAAVIPFFTGAKGIILHGWEPKSKGQYYHNLPFFMDSLGRVADLSVKIDRAQLIIDKPAAELWREKAPLVRKLKVSKNEWIIMAVYPWQNERERKIVTVNCGNQAVKIAISGKRTEIYHLQGNNLERIVATA
jgi:hypothetical protein